MSLEKTWEAVLARIQLELSPANFATWFKNTFPLEKKEEYLVIGVPNSFVKEWLQTKYSKTLLKIVRELDPSVRKLEFKVQLRQKQVLVSHKKTLDEFTRQRIANLNSKYTFDNFVVGGFNELAYAASVAVSENPGKVYNPLFVYGKVGLGKTHLLQAIGNKILTEKKDLTVSYFSAETLTSKIVQSIQNKSIEELKREYLKIDVLIIDDVQFLSGKEKTQEEFFHLFNSLYHHNKQIVLSCDRPPKAIEALAERLRSRFEGGMVVDISYPDFESRLAILKTKLAQQQKQLKEEILELIAKTIKTNIRELEGALNRILLAQEIKGKDITVSEAQKLLKELTFNPHNNLSPDKVIKIISEFYNIPQRELVSSSRKREIVRPRQIAMFLLKEILGCSYPFIAKFFGGKDHTTAIYAVTKIKKEIMHNEHLEQEIELLKIRLVEG